MKRGRSKNGVRGADDLAAMRAGAIQATVLAPPTTLKLKRLGFNQVADMENYDLYFYTSPLRRSLGSRPIMTRR